jgi:cardiolipin synthase
METVMKKILLTLSVMFAFSVSAHAAAPVASIAPGFYNNAQGSPVISMIQSAQQSIDIEIYTMYDLNVRNAIRNELAKNIPVRIIQEPAPDGDSCKPFTEARSEDNADCTDTKKLVKDVIAAGGSYIPYNKAALCATSSSCFQHGKLLIVDQVNALISTGNYDATSLCDLSQSPANCDRDYSFVDQDTDVVSALEQIFNNDLIGQSYDLASIVAPVSQKLTVSPLSLAPLVQFIQSAKTSIDLENQYLEQADLNTALETAAQSGVQVGVTVASLCAFGSPSSSASDKDTKTYSAFDSAGISSAMFTQKAQIDGTPGYLHAKAIVVDGNRAWLGSVNGSNSATSNNREFGVFFNNPAWVSALQTQIIADHGSSGSETWSQSLSCSLD